MKPIRVGLFLCNLSAARPRGVQRVARALAERLLESCDFELYAVSDPSFERVDTFAEYFGLADYLRCVPLVVVDEAPAPAPAPAPGLGKRLLRQSVLYGAKRLDFLPSVVANTVRGTPAYPVLRHVYRAVRRTVGTPSSERSPSLQEVATSDLGSISFGMTPLDWFDVLVSFEAFEDIWDWPTEQLRPQLLGIVYDTLPLRIDEGPGSRPDQLFRSLAKMTLRADHLICISEATERDLIAFFPNAAGKTSVMLLGHDVERFASARRPVRRPGQGPVRILMLGNMDRRKNVQNAYLAVPELARRLPSRHPIELIIAGNDVHRQAFAALEGIAAQHCAVRWTGYLKETELPSIMADADIFLFPSLWEGFGIPPLEAMSAGVPVVASDLSSMPEVLGPHGFYCDPYDPVSIAEALFAAATMSEADRTAWTERAAAHAAAFRWDVAAARLAEQIRAAFGASTPPPGGALAVADTTALHSA